MKLINSKEIILKQILDDNFSDIFIFVGNNRSFKIGNYIPDFINEEKKLIIEHYGSFWHSKTIEKDKLRIEYLNKLGYKVLVIWVEELDNKNKVIQKIKEFIDERL